MSSEAKSQIVVTKVKLWWLFLILRISCCRAQVQVEVTRFTHELNSIDECFSFVDLLISLPPVGILNNVVCKYLSTRVTKTCSAGQSKFKVLTIRLQSLPAHLGFWRHSTNTWREAKWAMRTCILSFLKIRINDRKSVKEFLSDIDCDFLQYVEKVHLKIVCLVSGGLKKIYLHFLSEAGRKRPVLNIWFFGQERLGVNSSLKQQTTSTRQLQANPWISWRIKGLHVGLKRHY